MLYEHTLRSAVESRKKGRLENWIHSFLSSVGGNIDLLDGLKLENRSYLGPIEMPIDLVERCCGPEAEMKYLQSADGFAQRVGRIKTAILECGNLPPILVNFSSGQLTLNDGNHRHEALKQLGKISVQAIIWTTGESDMSEFKSKYGFAVREIVQQDSKMDFFEVDLHDIGMIKPLWEKLNKIHFEESPYFRDYYSTFTFEIRVEDFLKMRNEDIKIYCYGSTENIFGYCISTIKNGIGEIKSICIPSELQNQGIGGNFIEASKKLFQERACGKVVVSVSYGHDSVLPFYEKHGFKPRLTLLHLVNNSSKKK